MAVFDDSAFPCRPVLYSAKYGHGCLEPHMAFDFLERFPRHRLLCTPGPWRWNRPRRGEDVAADAIRAARRGQMKVRSRVWDYDKLVPSLRFADGRETKWPRWIRWDDGLLTDLDRVEALRPDSSNNMGDVAAYSRDDIAAYSRDMAAHVQGTGAKGIGVAWIPECYDYRVHEYDGLETVSAEVPWERVARELARCLTTGEGASPIAQFLVAHPEGQFQPPLV